MNQVALILMGIKFKGAADGVKRNHTMYVGRVSGVFKGIAVDLGQHHQG
jgi:hypothetical protein